MANAVCLKVDTSAISVEKIDALSKAIREFPGPVKLQFDVRTENSPVGLMLQSKRFRVLLTDEFISRIEGILGREAIHLQN